MDEVKELLRRAHEYCERTKTSPSTLSRKLLGNGIRLAELEAGKSLRVDTLAKAKQALSQLEQAA
jgi:hypothetical protein